METAFLRNTLEQNQIIALFLSISIGYLLGKIKIASFSIGGISGTLFAAIIISMLGGNIDPHIKEIFLAIFMFGAGYEGGPALASVFSLRALKHVILTIFLVSTAIISVIVCARLFNLDKGMAAGIAAGALTQSGLLGTASDSINYLHLPASDTAMLHDSMAVGFAITYLFGVIVPIIFCINGTEWLFKRNLRIDALEQELQLKEELVRRESGSPGTDIRQPFILMVFDQIHLAGKAINEIEKQFEFFITICKVKRNGQLINGSNELVLQKTDQLLVFGRSDLLVDGSATIGQQMDYPTDEWNVELVTREITLKNDKYSNYSFANMVQERKEGLIRGACFLSIKRNGEKIRQDELANYRAKLGDIYEYYGLEESITQIALSSGNLFAIPNKKTDLISLSLGIILGLAIGSIKLDFFGTVINLGEFGVFLMGLLLGWLNDQKNHLAYIPASASKLLQDLGITVFVAGVGLNAGQEAFQNIVSHGGKIFTIGIIVALLPLVASYYFGRYILKYDSVAILSASLAGAKSSGTTFGIILERAGNNVPIIYFTITYTISTILITLAGPLLVNLA